MGIGGHFAGNADAGTAAVAPGACHAERALVASEAAIHTAYPCSLSFFWHGSEVSRFRPAAGGAAQRHAGLSCLR